MQSQSRNPALLRVLTITAAALVFALMSPGSAAAYAFRTLHSFCTEGNCGDGQYPKQLLLDSAGDLYGITTRGGKYTEGLVFKFIPDAGKGHYAEHILKNFCAQQGCFGGGQPYEDLISDTDGDLYGVTGAGGKHGTGTIFKMTPGANGWSYRVLHNFCEASCADGAYPASGLGYKGKISGKRWDGTSPLFGMTTEGGSGAGTVYELTTNGSSWTYKVIHKFQNASTVQSLIVDAQENLFGISAYSGKNSNGFLFELAHDTWKETVLHDFCGKGGCTDGAVPYGAIAMDGSGDIFGTAVYGGNGSCTFDDFKGCGVAYEFTAGGKYKVIYDFCALANCADGWRPVGGVVLDSAGNIFGTTTNGGVNNADNGVVFKLTTAGNEKVLYSFCSKANCKDGYGANVPMIVDAEGDLFGTTEEGGANGDAGIVFELTP